MSTLLPSWWWRGGPNWGCGERASEFKGKAGQSNRLSRATQNSVRTNAKSRTWKGRNGHQGDQEVLVDSKLNLTCQFDLASKKADISMAKGRETEDKVKQEMFWLRIRRSFFLITAAKSWERQPRWLLNLQPWRFLKSD